MTGRKAKLGDRDEIKENEKPAVSFPTHSFLSRAFSGAHLVLEARFDAAKSNIA